MALPLQHILIDITPAGLVVLACIIAAVLCFISARRFQRREREVRRVLAMHAELEQRLAYQAHHDPLTGLPNPALFEDRLQQAISQSRAVTTAMWG